MSGHLSLRTVLVGAAAVAVAAGVATGLDQLGGSPPPSAHTRAAAARSAPGGGRPSPAAATTSTSSTSTTAAPTTTTTVDPGTLPQTDTVPSATSPQFLAAMAALWRGVITGSVTVAMPAFFPEAAYLQVKSIANPAADYRDRLVAQYALDLGAAHALLGTDPASASLVDVEVPASYIHWVQPGTCYNQVGYFEVPNARVVYRQNGAIRSFGIASLISWRGQWYVVHLGAVLQSGSQGVVDDPANGPGVSAPYLTC